MTRLLAALPAPEAREALVIVARGLQARRDELVDLAFAAAGGPRATHEADLEFALEVVRTFQRGWAPQPGLQFRARGTVLLGLSRNEPLVVGVVPILAAAIGANRVLVRPSKHNVGFMTAVVAVFREAGFPDIELLDVDPSTVEQNIQRADLVLWMGSERVCREIGLSCAKYAVPYLPESEANDWVVLDDTLGATELATAVDHVVGSLERHGGQSCQAIRGILFPEPMRTALEAALRLRTAAATGVEPLWLPDVASVTAPQFGSRLAIVPYHTRDGLLASLRALNYGLSLAVYSGRATTSVLRDLADRLPTARVSINVDSSHALPAEPWGGLGKSGHWGVEDWPLRFVTRTQVRTPEPTVAEPSRVFGGRNAPLPYDGHYPSSVRSTRGPYVIGDRGPLLDLWMGFGAQLLGHADPRLASVLYQAALDGVIHTYSNPWEHLLAARLHRLIPSAEAIRFAVTGQEATSYAARIARAFTKRTKLVLIDGGYHGTNDSLGFRAPEGLLPAAIKELALVPFNDGDAMERALAGGDVAAVMMEPVLGNFGCIPPRPGYLEQVRRACSARGTLLVFDEVMSGFRKNLGGAQREFGVTPDVAVFGKSLGGGLPISVICGREEILGELVPRGQVAQEGTFYGNPLALRSALHVLERIDDDGGLATLVALAERILAPVRAHVEHDRLPVHVSSFGAMFSFHFGTTEVTSAAVQQASFNAEAFERFRTHLGAAGILYPPVHTESAFFCLAHDEVAEQLSRAFVAAMQHAESAL